MTDEPKRPQEEPAFGPAFQEALDELEHGLRSAFHAIEQIREVLSAKAPEAQAVEPPALRIVPRAREAEPAIEPAPAREPAADPYSPFERLWERMEHEQVEKQRQEAAGEPVRKGLELLPQFYLVTVEDREHRVDLVPLHRALQAVEGIDEITLVSFANGVPVVSLRAKHEIDLEQLSSAVASTLKRDCELIPQDTGRIFLRLTAREKIGV
jgi:translation elongation factor EF-1beta